MEPESADSEFDSLLSLSVEDSYSLHQYKTGVLGSWGICTDIR